MMEVKNDFIVKLAQFLPISGQISTLFEDHLYKGGKRKENKMKTT